MRFVFCSIILLTLLAAFSGTDVHAQRRDAFTDEEIELVRDAQDIDLRISVLTHAIDRRFGVLNINVSAPGLVKKESEKWGVLPGGSRLELLTDVKRILQKAVDDIDDTAAHAGTKQQREIENPDKKKDKVEPPFSRAVRFLGAAAKRYKPALESEIGSTKDPKERGTMLDTVDLCDQIIDAVSKLSTISKAPETPVKHR